MPAINLELIRVFVNLHQSAAPFGYHEARKPQLRFIIHFRTSVRNLLAGNEFLGFSPLNGGRTINPSYVERIIKIILKSGVCPWSRRPKGKKISLRKAFAVIRVRRIITCRITGNCSRWWFHVVVYSSRTPNLPQRSSLTPLTFSNFRSLSWSLMDEATIIPPGACYSERETSTLGRGNKSCGTSSGRRWPGIVLPQVIGFFQSVSSDARPFDRFGLGQILFSIENQRYAFEILDSVGE